MHKQIINPFSAVITISLLLLFLTTVVFADPTTEVSRENILYVLPKDELGDCTSWENACSLQTALGTASEGDEIWVVEGLYLPSIKDDQTESFRLKNDVQIYGGFTGIETARDERDWEKYPTILSGNIGNTEWISDNSFHVVSAINIDKTAILDGFIITGGYAHGETPVNDCGGGMYNNGSSPTLTNIIFSSNSAKNWGGGMYNQQSSPRLTNITFSDNWVTDYVGGGMGNYDKSNPTLIDVTFTHNSAWYGGGMYNHSSDPILTNVTFDDNATGSHEYIGKGGGLYNYLSSPTLTRVKFTNNAANEMGGAIHNSFSEPELSDLMITNNTAYCGGGISNYHSNPVINDAVFSLNSATYGGGMYNENNSDPDLINITFSGNTAEYGGGGIYNDVSDPTLTNITFFNNSALHGGGLYNFHSVPILINSILWANTPNQMHNHPTTDIPVITYSDIQGGHEGEGNIDTDPRLGPLANYGGFTQTHRLQLNSPVIDAGSPATCPITDQRGFSRPIDGNGDGIATCDMGAYESDTIRQLFLPLVIQ